MDSLEKLQQRTALIRKQYKGNKRLLNKDQVLIRLRLIAPLLAFFLLFSMWKGSAFLGAGLLIAILFLSSYLFWEVTGPIVFCIVLFLRPGEIIHPYFKVFHFGELAAMGCIVGAFFHYFLLGEKKVLRDPLSLLMLGLTLAIVLSTITSTDPGNSRFYLEQVWIKIVLLFFTIAYLNTQPRGFSAYIFTMILLTVVLASLGIHKGLTALPEQLVEGHRVGLGSLFGDPNDYAQLLLMSGLPYILSSIFHAPKKRYKLFFVIIIMLTFSALWMTRSRGGFMGFSASAAATLHRRVPTNVLVASTLALGSLVAIVFKIAKRGDTSGGIDESAQGRLDAWQGAIRMFIDRPLFGVGFECYPQNYLDYARDPVDWRPKAVHSCWFKVIAELGAFGSIFFFSLIFLGFKRAYMIGQWAANSKLQEKGYWFLEASLRSLFPALIGWSVAGTFLSNSFSWFLYILIALIIAATNLKREWEQRELEESSSQPYELIYLDQQESVSARTPNHR